MSAPGLPDPKQPAFYKRRRRRGNELGQLLLRQGSITAAQLREALRLQGEQGGHVGAILRQAGACTSREITEALILQRQLQLSEASARTDPSQQARQDPSLLGLQIRCSASLTMATLVLADLASTTLGTALIVGLELWANLPVNVMLGTLAIVPLSLGVHAASGLYSVTASNPPEELRRATLGTGAVFLGLWLAAFLMATTARTAAFNLAWVCGLVLTLLLVPVLRAACRTVLCRRSWWGRPVVVLGAGKVGRELVTRLQRAPELGLRPVAILDDEPGHQGTLRAAWGEEDVEIEPVSDNAPSSLTHDLADSVRKRVAWEKFSEVEGVPILGGRELAPLLAQRHRIRTAIVADPNLTTPQILELIEAHADAYSDVLVIPGLYDLAPFGAPTRSLGGMLGIEVKRRLLLRWPRLLKRCMDLALASVGTLAIAPVLLLLACWVALDSRGGIFYRQKRLGQDGVRFYALKFRTMYGDGEERLKALLEADPKLKAEYEEFHKLSVDPRVTRAGRFLRKYSLDELPQLFSVLAGDMSLVGPRPYLDRELPEMHQKEAIILRVKPGITGYWQVSARNESNFERRLQLDEAYVRNWSPWLDLYVLARTIPVVLQGTGA